MKINVWHLSRSMKGRDANSDGRTNSLGHHHVAEMQSLSHSPLLIVSCDLLTLGYDSTPSSFMCKTTSRASYRPVATAGSQPLQHTPVGDGIEGNDPWLNPSAHVSLSKALQGNRLFPGWGVVSLL